MPDTNMNAEQARALMADYVAVCNRAIRLNAEKAWFRKAKEASKLAFGGSRFRTVIYEDDPDQAIAEVILHFDAESDAVRIVPAGIEEVAFTWKVSTSYLRDVAQTRPDWYVANPLMLDWKWLADRVGDEWSARDSEPIAFGFLLGMAFACAASLLRPRHRY